MKDMIKSPVTTKVQPSPERLAIQMKVMERRYDEVLGKVLEQNALILKSIGRMQDDLKDLRSKMESLELSVEEEQVAKVNGVQGGRGDTSVGSTTPAGQTIPPGVSSPFPQAPPPVPPYYNPYQMYNPYMMMPLDPLNYLMNPATTMQYAALYGALNQNAAAAPPPPPAVNEPPKALPPFSFGVQLPPASTPVDTTPISFAPPKVSEPRKIENGNVVSSLAPSKVETPVVPASVTPPKPAPQPQVVPAAPAKTTVQPAVATPKTTASLMGTPATQKIATTSAPVSSAQSSIFGTPSFGTATSKSSIFGTPSFGTSPGVSFGTPNASSTFSTPVVTSASSIFAPATTTALTPKPTFTFGMTTSSQDKVDGPVFSLTPKPAAPTPTTAPRKIQKLRKELRFWANYFIYAISIFLFLNSNC